MLKNWDELFKKYEVHYDENYNLIIGKTVYPKDFVDILEKETVKLFPDVTDDNAEVILCWQLSVLKQVRA